ncbi:type III-B CRISPR module RAMP protein Cmr4 [Methanosarcina sp. DH1]|uniref:type III-B CRISPR module RAMP protein Cmr4 n=1 Tax=Methanosarcina sp. DH1 TaxID=2605695 RepID=UPI001E4EDED0|nr:type III-B CRISPR module RAMP protein Cmr4 [Methanosarcina sp. DH1]MCC4766891.1 type III-B CRISPR module RAMP protein Cmr4 [Methanosarcina sp. DH1]
MTQDNELPEYEIMFVNVVTPLHNGSGEGLGFVDNPILRERTTQFPIIQASSIKGVLRDSYDERGSPYVELFFGPPPGKGEKHSGAISFGDGQILAFPVRSVRGCFVWITSPHVLWRFYEKLCLMRLETQFPKINDSMKQIHSGLKKAMICPSGKNELCMQKETEIFLEEFPVTFVESVEIENIAKVIGEKVYGNVEDSFLKSEFEKKLVLLDDDTFRYFITNATEIVPNIRIGDSGTTKDGSLRYTEYLPSETIMYSTLIFEKSRKEDQPLKATDVKRNFTKNPPLTIQIGGDATIGKGIVKLSLPSLQANNLADK